jgi:hypothetical protein
LLTGSAFDRPAILAFRLRIGRFVSGRVLSQSYGPDGFYSLAPAGPPPDTRGMDQNREDYGEPGSKPFRWPSESAMTLMVLLVIVLLGMVMLPGWP